MVRADYCGEGKGTMRNGTLIDHYDAVDIEEPAQDPRFGFEAGWTASGAVCVRHVRIKENTSLERLAASCARMRERLGPSCTEESPAPSAPRCSSLPAMSGWLLAAPGGLSGIVVPSQRAAIEREALRRPWGCSRGQGPGMTAY